MNDLKKGDIAFVVGKGDGPGLILGPSAEHDGWFDFFLFSSQSRTSFPKSCFRRTKVEERGT